MIKITFVEVCERLLPQTKATRDGRARVSSVCAACSRVKTLSHICWGGGFVVVVVINVKGGGSQMWPAVGTGVQQQDKAGATFSSL